MHRIIADLAPATRARLTFTHLVALATVKDVPSRRLLADAAVQEGRTVAELQAATRRDQTREVRRVRGELKRTEKALDGVIGGLQALQAGGWASPGEREALRALIDEVKRRFEQIGQGVG